VADRAVDRRDVDGLTLVTLAGELDLACCCALRCALQPLPSARMPDLAVDLRQVTFMDCAAVGTLVRAYRTVRSAGGCLRLIGPQHGPARLLCLCELEGVLCVHDSVAAATAATCAAHAGGGPGPHAATA